MKLSYFRNQNICQIPVIKSFRYSFQLLFSLILLIVLPSTPPLQVQAASIPTFSIVSIVADESVTVKTCNFPADVDFTIRMGTIGTKGVGGTIVTTTNSGTGGSFQKTYSIPAWLKGSALIAIRMDSVAGYYGYNWFNNNSSGAVGGAATSSASYSGIPSFSVFSVVKGESVTIKTNNFPEDIDFKVRMGKYGTKGSNGTLVTTTNSGKGGSFDVTYEVPDGLKGYYKIAIRLESSAEYYCYNWFYNKTTAIIGEPITSSGDSDLFPTISIMSVMRDDLVIIRTSNFPADEEFTVRMGTIGTKGVGGTVVTTTNSGSGGTFEATYKIPDGLKGYDKISIRLESGNGHYAYNWFNN